MTQPADPFGAHLPAWADNQDAPWGRLRYALAAANLRRHLPDLDAHPRAVLDAGGGDGRDAVALAARGHAVTLVDASAAMLDEAQRRAEAQGAAGRLTVRRADLAALPGLFPAPAFDVVLCHNVLQYVGDLGAALRAVLHALRPGGLLSVICVNRHSEPYRRALMTRDPAGALAVLDAPAFPAVVFGGAPSRAYAVEDLRRAVEAAGAAVVGEYGIRCVCDYLQDNALKRDPAFFAALERLEYALSDRTPYRLLARQFQVIGRTAPHPPEGAPGAARPGAAVPD